MKASSENGVCNLPNDPDGQRLCQSIDWYAEGQTRTVEVNGVRVTIRLVGRHGRRARIAITAPTGAIFLSTPSGQMDNFNDSDRMKRQSLEPMIHHG